MILRGSHFLNLTFNILFNTFNSKSWKFPLNWSDYDVVIKTGAHSIVLRTTRCSYFKRALSSDWEEMDDDGN